MHVQKGLKEEILERMSEEFSAIDAKEYFGELDNMYNVLAEEAAKKTSSELLQALSSEVHSILEQIEPLLHR